jgi:hypothetical protein
LYLTEFSYTNNTIGLLLYKGTSALIIFGKHLTLTLTLIPKVLNTYIASASNYRQVTLDIVFPFNGGSCTTIKKEIENILIKNKCTIE